MVEQGFRQEFDAFDELALHLVMFSEDNTAIATCRIFNDMTRQTYILGRLAVLKAYRGKGVGSLLIAEAEEVVRKNGGKLISLHAQCQAEAFYAKAGYFAYGNVDDEEGCPHIWMRKDLLMPKEQGKIEKFFS